MQQIQNKKQVFAKIKKILLPVIVLLAIIAGIAYKLNSNAESAEQEIKKDQQPLKFAVNAAYAKSAETEGGLAIRGQVEARNVYTLYSEAEGRLSFSTITVGNSVSKGQNIASVDASVRLSTQKLNEQELRKTKLDYENAQKNYNRFKALLQNNNAATVEYENAKVQFDAAEVQIKIAEQHLDAAKIQVNQTQIFAPASGIIIDKKVNKGEYVQAGTPLGTLAENVLLVKCFVPENIAVAIRQNQQVTIKSDNQTKSFTGTIKTIVPAPNEAKLFPVIIELNNANTLMAGTGVEVVFAPTASHTSLQIPRAALVDDFKNPSVYVINDKKVPVKKSVTIGRTIGSNVEIISGITENELVIISGQSNIEPGKILADYKIIQ